MAAALLQGLFELIERRILPRRLGPAHIHCFVTAEGNDRLATQWTGDQAQKEIDVSMVAFLPQLQRHLQERLFIPCGFMAGLWETAP